ncbi:hypothetical protein BGZ50_006946, partial [Haplosporangium sp. Z 11]
MKSEDNEGKKEDKEEGKNGWDEDVVWREYGDCYTEEQQPMGSNEGTGEQPLRESQKQKGQEKNTYYSKVKGAEPSLVVVIDRTKNEEEGEDEDEDEGGQKPLDADGNYSEQPLEELEELQGLEEPPEQERPRQHCQVITVSGDGDDDDDDDDDDEKKNGREKKEDAEEGEDEEKREEHHLVKKTLPSHTEKDENNVENEKEMSSALTQCRVVQSGIRFVIKFKLSSKSTASRNDSPKASQLALIQGRNIELEKKLFGLKKMEEPGAVKSKWRKKIEDTQAPTAIVLSTLSTAPATPAIPGASTTHSVKQSVAALPARPALPESQSPDL